jgi:hypothetical protein
MRRNQICKLTVRTKIHLLTPAQDPQNRNKANKISERTREKDKRPLRYRGGHEYFR